MTRSITELQTLVFDCDGVVLDSNRAKTEAFRKAAFSWGKDAADALVAHHVANGGVSRYEKFRYFIQEILPDAVPKSVPGRDGPDLGTLLEIYAEAARQGLLTCKVADGIAELRAATPQARWLIVSGGDQAELRDVFATRGLGKYFDGGIFGSPNTKYEILQREIDNHRLLKPALFIGDSRLDHQASTRSGLDFVFVHGWTEMTGWESYVRKHQLTSIQSLRDLVDLRAH